MFVIWLSTKLCLCFIPVVIVFIMCVFFILSYRKEALVVQANIMTALIQGYLFFFNPIETVIHKEVLTTILIKKIYSNGKLIKLWIYV